MAVAVKRLEGPRLVIERGSDGFPDALEMISKPPKRLYAVGDIAALVEGLAIVGARKATPYGKTCARRFAKLAAERGICVISGGARGCDAISHEAAMEAGGRTVVFLGGGCDCVYPPEHFDLFQRIVNGGGIVVSEQDWTFQPLPYTFRARNRLIAGLARATLIVEAGLPSGTFSTADEALAANRDVLAVPGAITSAQSLGANRLISQGAIPIVDDETFSDQLFSLFGCLKQEDIRKDESDGYGSELRLRGPEERLLSAVRAEPLDLDSLRLLANEIWGGKEAVPSLMLWLAEASSAGQIAQYPDGRYGPA